MTEYRFNHLEYLAAYGEEGVACPDTLPVEASGMHVCDARLDGDAYVCEMDNYNASKLAAGSRSWDLEINPRTRTVSRIVVY